MIQQSLDGAVGSWTTHMMLHYQVTWLNICPVNWVIKNSKQKPFYDQLRPHGVNRNADGYFSAIPLKVKVKLTLEQATKAQKGSRGIYSFFNLGARWGWVVNETPRPLYPRKRPGTHCIGSWAPGHVWTGAENLVPIGIRSQDRQVRSESL